LELPPPLDALRAESWAPGTRGWVPIQHAAKLAALDLRAKLPGSLNTRVSQAALVDECLDALAVGRDISYSRGLLGDMIASAIVGIVHSSCAAVLDVVSADEKRRSIATLLALHDAMRPYETVLLDESVFGQLAWAKSTLSATELTRLPTEASAMAQAHPSELDGLSR